MFIKVNVIFTRLNANTGNNEELALPQYINVGKMKCFGVAPGDCKVSLYFEDDFTCNVTESCDDIIRLIDEEEIRFANLTFDTIDRNGAKLQ